MCSNLILRFAMSIVTFPTYISTMADLIVCCLTSSPEANISCIFRTIYTMVNNNRRKQLVLSMSITI